MRRTSRIQHKHTLKNEMNVVPYIDVMLVLLVIFMVTAPLITPGVVKVPTVHGKNTTQALPSNPVEIQVEQNGDLSYRLRQNNQAFQISSEDTIIEQILSLPDVNTQTPIALSADGQVPYQNVMTILNKLKQAGFNTVGVIVDQKP